MKTTTAQFLRNQATAGPREDTPFIDPGRSRTAAEDHQRFVRLLYRNVIQQSPADRILLLPPGEEGSRHLFGLLYRKVIKRLSVAAILCALCPLAVSGATFRWAPSSNRIFVE